MRRLPGPASGAAIEPDKRLRGVGTLPIDDNNPHPRGHSRCDACPAAVDGTGSTLMTVAMLAHQGGWDEGLLVAGPLLAIIGLLWLAKRRADRMVRPAEPADDTD